MSRAKSTDTVITKDGYGGVLIGPFKLVAIDSPSNGNPENKTPSGLCGGISTGVAGFGNGISARNARLGIG